MKNLLNALFAIFILSTAISCNKNTSSTLTEVTFTSIDYTKCATCGGFYGTIGNEKIRALDIVPNTILNESTQLPKSYIIKYEKLSIPTSNTQEVVIKVIEIQHKIK